MLIALEPAAKLTTSGVLQEVFPAATLTPTDLQLEEQPVFVISQSDEPRWIIVGDTRKAFPVLRSWRPFNLSSRVRWNVVSLAAFGRVLERLPGVKFSRARIDHSYWQDRLPGPPKSWNVVIHIGNPSHTRKATAFFISEDGQITAVGKVPLTRIAGRSILNEADVLLRLQQWEWLPRVLLQDPGRGIAAQSWLVGEPVGRSFTSAHLNLLCRFANKSDTIRISDQRESIEAQLNALDSSFDHVTLSRALKILEFDQPLPSFVEHRDFAPWNLKRLSSGDLGLVDWEWAVTKSLPFQDACRFFYMSDAVFDGPGGVWESMSNNPLLQTYCARFAIPGNALRPLVMHYLLRVLCMDAEINNTRLTNYTYRQIQVLLAAE